MKEAIQNIHNISEYQEHIAGTSNFLAPSKEHKVPIVGFRDNKGIKDYLVRATLPKIDNAGGSEPCGKGTCQVCDHIITTNTFTTKACWEVFKIQSGPLKCNSEKVLYLLWCKICDDNPYVGKAKTKFCFRFNNFKSKNWSFRKGKQNVLQKRFHSYYVQDCHKDIDDWEVTLLEKCETHKQFNERETFWQYKLKTLYPHGLNEKQEYLF